tara:strand:- start:3476 stop:4234 length:759 start_codon:yes stop_codon:yes gene_type:complete
MGELAKWLMISVIIPSYNQLEGLRKTIGAFTKYRGEDFEIVVIDGESTDGSSEWLMDHNSVIDKLLIETDKGIYDAMNKGVKLSCGDYLWFMGTGDLPIDFGVQKMFSDIKKDLDKNPKKMYAYGVHLLSPREPGVPEFYNPVWDNKLLWRNTIHHQGGIYSRELFSSTKYDLRFRVLSDYHLHLRLLKKGINCICSSTMIAEVAPGGVSRNFSLSLYKEERDMKRDVLTGWESMVQVVWTGMKWLNKKVRF